MAASSRLSDYQFLLVQNDTGNERLTTDCCVWLQSTSESLGLAFSRFGATDDSYHSAKSIPATAGKNRSAKLLIAGAFLEDLVTFASLAALFEGFDVHLLADFIQVKDLAFAPQHWQRLYQSGCVPTTMMQTLKQWKFGSQDRSEADRIEARIAELSMQRSASPSGLRPTNEPDKT